MNQYIGVKLINAKPMTRAEYNDFRGWQLPRDENGDDKGFLVEYQDGGKGNTDLYAGYVSWSPEEVFHNAYALTTGMTFGLAVEAMKKSKSITRAGWNSKGMYLFIIQGSNDIAKLHGYGFGEMLNEPTFRDAIFMKTVDNELVPWTASQTDMLANDWSIVQ
jgi:hypothetical protein